MSTCLVCGAAHAVEEPAHKKITEIWNRLGAVEAAVREFAKPAYVFPASTTTATTANVTYTAVPDVDAENQRANAELQQPATPPEQSEPQGA